MAYTVSRRSIGHNHPVRPLLVHAPDGRLVARFMSEILANELADRLNRLLASGVVSH